MNMSKIFDVENRTGVQLPALDINQGVLRLDKAYDVIAVLCDRLLPDTDIARLKACKKVVHVGTAQYRHAPEIVHSVVYIKA